MGSRARVYGEATAGQHCDAQLVALSHCGRLFGHAKAISGAEAFQRYIEHTLPHLRESGGELMFLGSGNHFLIGPLDERWDMVMLVRQQSVASFMAFASHEAYLAGIGHRTAALEDSRLLPLSEPPIG